MAVLIMGSMPPLAGMALADEVLEEVVVSGYRLQPLTEAELSVSVLDSGTIEQAGLNHLQDLYRLVPNLNWSGEGARPRYLQLRGIGEREQYEGAPNPSVGFIIDDIDLSGVGGVASTFDLERVEVLRGPQSARFGASALAGVIYQRSTAPTGAFDTRGELTVGDDGLLALGAAVGGALSSTVNGRFSVFHHGSDGFRDNAFTGSATNERDELTVRGKLAWAMSDEWDSLLSVLLTDFDNGYDAFTVNNDAITWSDNPGEDAQSTRAASLRVQGPLNAAVELVSITALTDSDIDFSFDGDWGNPQFWQRYGDYVYDFRYRNPRQRDNLSQELRLLSAPGAELPGNTSWVVGVFYNRLSEDNQIDSTGVYDDSGEENFCAPCLTDRQLSSQFEADTIALFLSTESQLSDRWRLSTGLRYERWSADYADQWADINYPGPPGGSSCSQFDCSPDDNLWGGHLALAYQFSGNTEGYLRLARGFKAGGFNPSLAALQGLAVLGPEFISYQSESLMNYETGMKGDWLGGDLQADVSVFYMQRSDAQLSQSSQQLEFDPNSFVFVTYNGDADVYGLEASAQWQLNRDWALHGALGLLESNINDNAATRQVSPGAIDRDLAHAPAYTLNVGASVDTGTGWFGRLDVNAVDAFYFDISHNQRSSAYTTANVRLGKRWGSWALSAWVRNLTDEHYATRGFFFGNEPPDFANTVYTRFGDPRSYGLTLSYQYAN